jgi:nitroimidazol reductase NimA-like FMN-containing flavoprotein (pyridoxamine 5'-phosphate oxidase superfamily)
MDRRAVSIDASILRSNSAWPSVRIEQFLREATIPARLAVVTAGGAPLVCSLWYVYEDGALWFATRRDARLVAMLQREPRCGFEVAGDAAPYRGVRGQGRGTLSAERGPAVLVRLVDRYLGTRDSKFARWLLARQQQEIAIRVDFEWLTSWDFTARMSR